eukprot:COSAG01_NODE_644_length_14557_cov_8.020057_12_plen_67_part_00
MQPEPELPTPCLEETDGSMIGERRGDTRSISPESSAGRDYSPHGFDGRAEQVGSLAAAIPFRWWSD